LGAARLSEDDLSGSVVPVVEQLCHVGRLIFDC
jgi:hypothetical protein